MKKKEYTPTIDDVQKVIVTGQTHRGKPFCNYPGEVVNDERHTPPEALPQGSYFTAKGSSYTWEAGRVCHACGKVGKWVLKFEALEIARKKALVPVSAYLGQFEFCPPECAPVPVSYDLDAHKMRKEFNQLYAAEIDRRRKEKLPPISTPESDIMRRKWNEGWKAGAPVFSPPEIWTPKDYPVPEQYQATVSSIIEEKKGEVRILTKDTRYHWTTSGDLAQALEMIHGTMVAAAEEDARRDREAQAILAGVAKETARGNLRAPAAVEPEFAAVPFLPTVAALRRFIKPGVRLELLMHSHGSKHLGTIREVKTVQTNAFSMVDAAGKESWLNFPKASEYGSTADGFTVNDGSMRMQYKAHPAAQAIGEGGDKEGEGGKVSNQPQPEAIEAQPAPAPEAQTEQPAPVDPAAWIRETLEAVTQAPAVDQATAAALAAGGKTETTTLCTWIYLPKEAAEARETVKAAGFKWAQKRLGWYKKHDDQASSTTARASSTEARA